MALSDELIRNIDHSFQLNYPFFSHISQLSFLLRPSDMTLNRTNFIGLSMEVDCPTTASRAMIFLVTCLRKCASVISYMPTSSQQHASRKQNNNHGKGLPTLRYLASAHLARSVGEVDKLARTPPSAIKAMKTTLEMFNVNWYVCHLPTFWSICILLDHVLTRGGSVLLDINFRILTRVLDRFRNTDHTSC